MLPRVPPHVPACGITGRFNTRPSSVLGSTRPSTSPSSAHLVSIQPDGLPRGVAVTVMLSTPPHAQRRRRMLSAAAACSAPPPLAQRRRRWFCCPHRHHLRPPTLNTRSCTFVPPSVANLVSSRIGERRKAPVVSHCAQRAATDHHALLRVPNGPIRVWGDKKIRSTPKLSRSRRG